MILMRVGTSDGVVTLRGDGVHWTLQDHQLAGQDVWVVAHQSDHPQTIYAGTYGQGLFRSDDEGAHWRLVGVPPALAYIRVIAFAPDSPQVLYVGTEPANIYRSEDGGDTWQDLEVRQVAGSESWSLPYSPRAGAVRALSLPATRPGLIYGGVEQGGVLISTDNGAHWTISHDGDQGVHRDIHSLSVHPQDDKDLLAATGGGLFRTRDGGQQWEMLVEGYTRAVTRHPIISQHLFTAPARRVGHEGRILSSSTDGASWTPASDPLPLPMPDMVESFVTHPLLLQQLYAVRADGTLMQTSLNTIAWTAVPIQFHVHSIALWPDA